VSVKLRMVVASCARDLFDEKISYNQFINSVEKQYCGGDTEIDQLLQLIEDEPQRGLFGNFDENKYKHCLERIIELIEKLS